MTKILHINSSINKENSNSKKLSTNIIDHLKSINNDATVDFLDLIETPLSHLNASDFVTLATNDYLISFLDHDVIVVGAPMYNFGIPSQLKAWLDRLAVSGKTFRYTENGAEGLVKNKKIIIASTRGGFYAGNDAMKSFEHQESYLLAFFNFLGITDIQIIRLEGLGMGGDSLQKAFLKADEEVKKIK
jgi:FMN-dependent NADH-azoreductase